MGGEDAEIQDHPHQASLRTIVGFHFCGATIITGHFVLTAAHCVAGRVTSTFVIIPGITQLSVGGIRHPVQRIVVYPNYNSITMQNDIAIVETGDVMVFSNLVNPALLSTDVVEGGVTASFTGWGLTSVSIPISAFITNTKINFMYQFPVGQNPDMLQRIQVDTISNDECREQLTDSAARNIFDSSICTATVAGQGTCHGDSGGALLLGDTVVGISSWNLPCGLGRPDVFVRVSNYVPWIQAIASF